MPDRKVLPRLMSIAEPYRDKSTHKLLSVYATSVLKESELSLSAIQQLLFMTVEAPVKQL